MSPESAKAAVLAAARVADADTLLAHFESMERRVRTYEAEAATGSAAETVTGDGRGS